MAIGKYSAKEFFRIYGIFIGILVFVFLISIGFIKLSQNKWQSGLKETVQSVLDENTAEKYLVQDYIPLLSPFSVSSALYKIRSRETGKNSFAYIIRIPTLYGPLPAVYIYNKNETEAEFVGFANVHGRIKKIIEDRKSDIFINYWQVKIPKIICQSISKYGDK